jgi:hypothetical protein
VQLQQSQLVCVVPIISSPAQQPTFQTLAWYSCPRIPSLEDEVRRISTFAAGAPLGAAVGNTLGAVLTQLSELVVFSPTTSASLPK